MTHASKHLRALSRRASALAADLAFVDVKMPGSDGLELIRRLRTRADTAKLAIVRDGKDEVVNVTIGNMPNDRQAKADTGEEQGSGGDTPTLGLSLAPANQVNGLSGPGVAVTQVDPDGPAAERGFKVGDVILEVNGARVGSPTEVKKAITDARGGGKRTVLMRVKSGEGTRYVAIPVGNA